MSESVSEATKNEIIEMILSGGLLQDFIEYLKSKGINLEDIKSIYEVDDQLIKEYAMMKKIICDPNAPSQVAFDDDVEEKYEPQQVKPKTPPRKKL